MKDFECDLYLDLMPLVKDGAASEASAKALERHMEQCKNCRRIYESLAQVRQDDIGAAETLKKLRRRILIGAVILIVVAVLAGIGMTNTTSIVYNSVIFPLVGIVGFLFLRKWAWAVPVGVQAVSFSWLSARYFLMDGLSRGKAYDMAATWSIEYAISCAIGIGIAAVVYFCVTPPKEKGWKPRLERIGATLLAGSLGFGIIFCYYIGLGNSFIKEKIRIESQSYIVENYQEQDLRVWDPLYNYLEGSYRVRVDSETSEDTRFSLVYDRWGNFSDDGYELSVLSGNQTMARLIREYESAVQEQIAVLPEMDYVTAVLSGWDAVTGVYAPLNHGIDPGTLEVDGKYDVKKLGAQNGYVYISCSEETVSFERAAQLLKMANAALKKAGVGVYAYEFTLSGEHETIRMEMVRSSDLETEDVAARLEELWKTQQP